MLSRRTRFDVLPASVSAAPVSVEPASAFRFSVPPPVTLNNAALPCNDDVVIDTFIVPPFMAMPAPCWETRVEPAAVSVPAPPAASYCTALAPAPLAVTVLSTNDSTLSPRTRTPCDPVPLVLTVTPVAASEAPPTDAPGMIAASGSFTAPTWSGSPEPTVLRPTASLPVVVTEPPFMTSRAAFLAVAPSLPTPRVVTATLPAVSVVCVMATSPMAPSPDVSTEPPVIVTDAGVPVPAPAARAP
ncbi:hypothetical protein D3C81_830620 [compost metagenome]